MFEERRARALLTYTKEKRKGLAMSPELYQLASEWVAKSAGSLLIAGPKSVLRYEVHPYCNDTDSDGLTHFYVNSVPSGTPIHVAQVYLDPQQKRKDLIHSAAHEGSHLRQYVYFYSRGRHNDWLNEELRNVFGGKKNKPQERAADAMAYLQTGFNKGPYLEKFTEEQLRVAQALIEDNDF